MARKVKFEKIIKAIKNKTYSIESCAMHVDPRTTDYHYMRERLKIVVDKDVLIVFKFDAITKNRTSGFFGFRINVDRTYRLNEIELFHGSEDTSITKLEAEYESEWNELETITGALVEEYFDTAFADPIYNSIVSNII